jgi:hypothetical protein
MTNLLDRLAMRALGVLPVIRPVPQPRFAAAPSLDASPVPPREVVAEDPPSTVADLGSYLTARRSGRHERL